MRRPSPAKIVLAILILLVVFIVAALLAPRVEANSMREPLRRELASILGRDVTFRDVRYSLFPQAGLTAADLIIPEDPVFGLEPFAYVTELRVGLRWTALLTGRFEIDSVQLGEASVNLARRDDSGWNAGRLLENVRHRVKATGRAPQLVLRNGRVNFTEGTMKSAFFLNTVELELDLPSRDSGSLEWSFEASPARTDRSEQGFGRFTGQGVWTPGQGRGGRIDVEMELERSVLTEVVTLVAGRDLGLQGRLSSRVRMGGPLEKIEVRGRLDLEGLERSGLLGSRGDVWVMPYEGVLDLSQQRFEFRSATPQQGVKPPPLGFRISAEDALTNPKLEVAVTFEDLPASNAVELASRLGARVPAGLEVQGTLTGSLTVPRGAELSGAVELKAGAARLGGAGPVMLPAATFRIAGPAVEMEPAEVQTPAGNSLTLSGRWSAASEALSFTAKLKDLALDELNTAVRVIPGAPEVPVLSVCEAGTISGELLFARDIDTGPAPWTGDLTVAGSRCRAEGSDAPIDVSHASIAFRGGNWTAKRVQASWGGLDFRASAARRASDARPFQADLEFERLDAGQLVDVLKPALARRRSFLDRTFRRGQAAPAWLRSRRAKFSVRSRVLEAAGHTFENLAATAYWDGTQIEIPTLELRKNGARISGRLAVGLQEEEPEYHLLGSLSELEWAGALLDADLDVRASGNGQALLESLRASGYFRVAGLEVDGIRMRNAGGCYDIDMRRPAGGRVRLRCLEALVEGELLTGSGGSTGEGRLGLDLSSPNRTLRLSGPVWPVELSTGLGPASAAR